jgi:hypothetical protein
MAARDERVCVRTRIRDSRWGQDTCFPAAKRRQEYSPGRKPRVEERKTTKPQRGERTVRAQTLKTVCHTLAKIRAAFRYALYKNKKASRPFSRGRLGSPPPELPNHVMDSKSGRVSCKRHLGNRKNATSESMPGRQCRQSYGCFCQVWPSSAVVQTSGVEVVILPCCRSEKSTAVMSPVNAVPGDDGKTRVQWAPASREW